MGVMEKLYNFEFQARCSSIEAIALFSNTKYKLYFFILLMWNCEASKKQLYKFQYPSNTSTLC